LLLPTAFFGIVLAFKNATELENDTGTNELTYGM